MSDDKVYVLCAGLAGYLPDATEAYDSQGEAEDAAQGAIAALEADESEHSLYSVWIEEWNRNEWENSND